ncbi:MAG: thioredoxin family protein [Crocinitomix sp.]|nr:thioredoxin family protein [Crocinitomix sp.]
MQYTNSFTFEQYFSHIQALLKENKTTGEDQSQERVEATKINVQRIKRIHKRGEVHDSVRSLIQAHQPYWEWTLIVEAWCGDAAQIIPYLNKVSELGDSINLNIILRDENLEIMDQFLTNKGRAIPILICQNVETNAIIGHWGPRPNNVIEWIANYRTENLSFEPDAFKKDLHLFYAKDKGKGINEDLLSQLKEWLKN